MSTYIKVGDVCEILPGRNPQCLFRCQRLAGMECTVVRLGGSGGHIIYCCTFEICDEQVFLCNVPAIGRSLLFARSDLRKKPPTSGDHGEPRVVHIPADPSAWDLTHWHPNKTKEHA